MNPATQHNPNASTPMATAPGLHAHDANNEPMQHHRMSAAIMQVLGQHRRPTMDVQELIAHPLMVALRKEGVEVREHLLQHALDRLAQEDCLRPDGPSGPWHAPDPSYQFQRARDAQRTAQTLHLVMPIELARMMGAACEAYARMGLGQFNYAAEALRFSPVNLQSFDDMDSALTQAKSILLHQASSASHGIYSLHVHTAARQCWAVYRALRHRMAWDANPAGDFGVSFDEPLLAEDSFCGLDVFSTDKGQTLHLVMNQPEFMVVCEALELHARLCRLEFSAIADLHSVLRDANGQPVNAVARRLVQAMLQEADKALAADLADESRTDARLKAWLLAQDHEASACSTWAQFIRVHGKALVEDAQTRGQNGPPTPATGSPTKFDLSRTRLGRDLDPELRGLVPQLPDLPFACAVRMRERQRSSGYRAGSEKPAREVSVGVEYQVVAVSPDGHALVQLEASSSIQTALMKATRWWRRSGA